MADLVSKEKPNLKICIDNTDSETDDETSLSLTDGSDVGEEEKAQQNDSDQVEFNVRIGKRQPTVTETTTTTLASKPKYQPKRYENKAGEFICGIDLTDEQLEEKREERAKRFGISAKAPKLDYEGLERSLGVTSDKYDERGIRPEAIHMRGLDEMHTQDVFRYFQEFPPGSIEWIDDASCNVVWADKTSAGRALMKLSRSQKTIEKFTKRTLSKNNHKDSKTESKEKESLKKESSQDEDDDDLDLTEDVESKNKENDGGSKSKEDLEMPMDTSESETKVEPSTEINQTEEMEEGEVSSDSESESDSEDSISNMYKDLNLSRVIWPPGKWRLGIPCPKAKYLYFRFATKADVKLPGAEKRSKFYVRHGNPNFGGMKGLISHSRKRQHWSRRGNQDDEEDGGLKFDVKVPRGRELPDYSDVSMFTGTGSTEESKDMDTKPTRKIPTAYGSEGEDWEDEDEITEDEIQPHPPPALFTRGYNRYHEDRLSPLTEDSPSRGGNSSEDGDDTTELELQKLLAVPRRSGRMYADDVEDEIKAKVSKRSTDPNDLTVVTNVKERLRDRLGKSSSPVEPVQDARQLISGKGVDLRKRLQSKREKITKKAEDSDSSKFHPLRIKVYD